MPTRHKVRRKDQGHKPSALTRLQSQLEARLRAAHFRYLNEQLYSLDSHEVFQLFLKQPELFALYHKGYQEQVAKWPLNPTQVCLELLKRRIHQFHRMRGTKAHPQNTTFNAQAFSIVDMGCGEATIAASLDSRLANSWSARNGFTVEVHSYDFVAANELVTACDLARGTGLPNDCADAVVFCLSLMGPNYGAMVKEGLRLLRCDPTRSGLLLIIEITSRFQSRAETRDTPGARVQLQRGASTMASTMSSSVEADFVVALESLGLRLQEHRQLHDYFTLFVFEATESAARRIHIIEMPSLKPCLYKKR